MHPLSSRVYSGAFSRRTPFFISPIAAFISSSFSFPGISSKLQHAPAIFPERNKKVEILHKFTLKCFSFSAQPQNLFPFFSLPGLLREEPIWRSRDCVAFSHCSNSIFCAREKKTKISLERKIWEKIATDIFLGCKKEEEGFNRSVKASILKRHTT